MMFIQKYAPKTLDDLRLPKRIIDLLNKIEGDSINYRLLFYSSPGTGKCLGRDTEVLMFDGSVKKVQDIIVGDQLMGIDSTPRNVLSLARGQEQLYEIIQNNGENFVCNESHILSFVESGTWKFSSSTLKPNKIEDLNIKQTLELPKNHRKKLFKVALNFKKQDVLIDPYWLGYWLGDGISSKPSFCVGYNDFEIVHQNLVLYANKLGLKISIDDSHQNTKVISLTDPNYQRNDNILLEYLRKYNVYNNKHIPKEYLLNDLETRKKLFAGLVDSDVVDDIKDKTYDFCLVNERLRDDIAWLARSLGYKANKTTKVIKNKNYFSVIISGDFEDLELLHKRKYFGKQNINKNQLVSGFKIKKLEVGDYFGFEIDGDRRFMLGDFTVTHNTSTAKLLGKGKDILYLSGSNDFNIDTMRDKIYQFSGNHSLLGKRKLVIIDEAENIRNNLQDAFKIVLDQSTNVSFIFITNEIAKMNDAIKSRCTMIDYNFAGKEIVEQQLNYTRILKLVCDSENIKFDSEGAKFVIKRHFPDIRHLLIILEQFKNSGKDLTQENVVLTTISGNSNLPLYEIIVSSTIIDQKTIFENTSEFKGKEKECLESLGEPFFEYLNSLGKYEHTLKAAPIVAKYTNMFIQNNMNSFSSLLACVVELKTLFR